MSVRYSSAIWESGRFEGGVLLVALALADYANDEGECWPKAASIATKVRLTLRQTHNILRKLEKAGFLTIQSGGGRGKSSWYRLNLETVKPVSVNSNSVKPISVKSEAETVKSTTENSEICVNAIRKNRHEPSIEPSALCEFCQNTGVVDVKAHPGRQRYCVCTSGRVLQKRDQLMHSAVV
jgi:MarR-like DNA-binding transcriptional regulator SgrR of sgrS sRNA